MSTPTLIADGALDGVSVAVSVSTSADLDRLGLTDKHAQLAVGELARAILVAGGRIVYGGRIRPPGFTQFLMHEVDRYGRENSFTLCLVYPEHRKLPLSEIQELDRSFGVLGHLVHLDPDGQETDPTTDREEAGREFEDPDVLAASYSGLRRFMATISDARVVVGGQLDGYKGRMPGLIEEALVTLREEHPLYVAGGFGGAAAAIADAVGADLSWAPPGLPEHDPSDGSITAALDRLRVEAAEGPRSLSNGLTGEEAAQLSCSHRPGEIASLVVLGLSRATGTHEDDDA